MRERYLRVKTWIADVLSPLRPVYDAWMWLVAGFGWLLARVVLTVAFFTIFTVYGVVLRLTGKDPMDRTLDEDRPSYWEESVLGNETVDEFKTQY